ncbi:MAG: hypothetical protein H3C54_11405 [Taibaiella sp.]|nr:hypothetical protein [Taibaiella sp.]
MCETTYKHILDLFLTRQIDVKIFIDQYFAQWESDRDNAVSFDPKFERMIGRIFTSCDCYSEDPENPYEISEEQLRLEIDLLRYIWWG